jgi:hypothetical protein
MMGIIMLAVCIHHFWFQKCILAMYFMLHGVYIRSALTDVGNDEPSDYMVAVASKIITPKLLECAFCLDICLITRGTTLKSG